MASNYPAALDSFSTSSPADTLATAPGHAAKHNDTNDAVAAVQSTLGLNPQGWAATVAARLAGMLRKGTNIGAQSGSGANTQAVSDLNAYLLSGWYDGSNMTGAPDSGWWLIHVHAHSNGAHWQRQVAYSMTTETATQSVYSRRCNGGAPTDPASWSAWSLIAGGGDTAWHAVGAVGEPAFENGWTNYSASWVAARFRKDVTGRVYVEGFLDPTNATSEIVFTLPTGYRPSHHKRVPGGQRGDGAVTRVTVLSTTGAVYVGGFGGGSWVGFDINFLAEK